MNIYIKAAEGLSARQRQKIARDSNDPKELARLAYDNAASVRATVAGNSHTPAKVLVQLANDPDPSVRGSVINNEHTPWQVVKQHISDPDIAGYANYRDLNTKLASNLTTPVDVLEGLADDDIDYDPDESNYSQNATSRRLSHNPNCSPQLLEQLSTHPNTIVRGNVATNPNTPVDILDQLADDSSARVREDVVSNPNTLEDTIARLLDHENDESVLWEVARRDNISADILAELWDKIKNSSSYVKKSTIGAIAKNPNTPDDILEHIIDTDADDLWMMKAVLENPSLSADLLDKLVHAKNLSYYVLNDPRVPTEVLDARAAWDTDSDTLYRIALNPNASPETLAKIATSRKKQTKEAAMANPNYDPSIQYTKQKKPAQSDWSIPLYSIQDYSQIENEIDEVIDQAANQYAQKYLGGSATVYSPEGIYDTDGEIEIQFATPDGETTSTIDVADIIGPATSQNKKSNCVKTLLRWFEQNLDI